MKELTKRFRNYGTVAALVSWLFSVLELSGALDLTGEEYELYVVGGLNVLVLLGVLNNPSKGKAYKDEEVSE